LLQLRVNGEEKNINTTMNLQEFLDQQGLDSEVIIVELNSKVVNRLKYRETFLKDGDVLEIAQFMGGG